MLEKPSKFGKKARIAKAENEVTSSSQTAEKPSKLASRITKLHD